MLDAHASPSERAESDPARDEDAQALPGVQHLRQRRGGEQVTFNDVADRLVEFAERHPHARGEIENLANFLAGVEQHPHGQAGATTATPGSDAG